MNHALTDPMPGADPHRQQILRFGMGMFLGTVTMLFGAFSSAYIVRGATSTDWLAVQLPSFLWINTVLIVISSLTLVVAVRAARAGSQQAAARWLGATLFLAVAFLGGQYAAWTNLWQQGIGVPTTPHASFFFILTGVHAVHLIAGLAVLGVAAAGVHAGRTNPAAAERALVPLSLGAMLWHFLAALWVYLIIMLTVFA